MKKLVLLFAAATMAVSVSAQSVSESKTFDNIYVGINGGVATKTTGHKWLSDLDPNFGVRVGRYFTPVFGLAVEGNGYFSNKPYPSTKTAFRAVNTQLLGTVNLSNWLGGYKGEPRAFEVSALYGLGWFHMFAHPSHIRANRMSSKAAVDFAFNFGSKKQWQFYIEPSMNWLFLGKTGLGQGSEAVGDPALTARNDQPAYDIKNSFVQLNAGLIYKFKNSNGTHNFTIVRPYDQVEVDGLNAEINRLRNELAKKPKEVVKEVIKEVKVGGETKTVKVEDLVFVTFAQGKSALTKDAKSALDGVKSGAHVQIVGTASPEGPADLNKRLSQARADVVADYLRGRGVVVDEATGKGVQGTTSNRLAIVYLK